MTHKDKVSYASTPPCKGLLNFFWRCHCDCRFTATQYNTPQHTATHRSTDRSTPQPCCNTIYHTLENSALMRIFNCFQCFDAAIATASPLQHTADIATHCNALKHPATHCNTLQWTATHCNTLQHTATHCNTLQHTTTHYNTPQHSATHCTTPLRIPWWWVCQTSAQRVLVLPLQLPLYTFPPAPLPLHGQLRY